MSNLFRDLLEDELILLEKALQLKLADEPDLHEEYDLALLLHEVALERLYRHAVPHNRT